MSAQYIYDENGLLTGVFYGMPKQPNGTMIEPPPPEDGVVFRFSGGAWKRPVVDKRITRLAFLNRFSMEEWIELDASSATVPSLKYFITKINAARHIDLALDEVRNGMQLLAANGMLSAARLVEIMDTPIRPDERPEPGAEVA